MDKTALRTAAAKYGTPLYLFDLEAFTARAQRVRAAFGSDVNLCYSMKANPFVLRGLPDVFRWVEVCSPGELTICEKLGIAPERILYSGVNKGADDVARAVALQHEMIPRAQRVLDGGGIGERGREAVFKAQHIVARRMRELGRQYARIAEVAARVAAAVAV